VIASSFILCRTDTSPLKHSLHVHQYRRHVLLSPKTSCSNSKERQDTPDLTRCLLRQNLGNSNEDQLIVADIYIFIHDQERIFAVIMYLFNIGLLPRGLILLDCESIVLGLRILYNSGRQQYSRWSIMVILKSHRSNHST